VSNMALLHGIIVWVRAESVPTTPGSSLERRGVALTAMDYYTTTSKNGVGSDSPLSREQCARYCDKILNEEDLDADNEQLLACVSEWLHDGEVEA